jgi:hypothetical protein
VHDRPFTRVKDPYLLLTALINAFPCFTNLRNLSLRNTHFTQNRLENLRLLLKLTVLEVDMCSVADGEVIDLSMLIPLAISHFIFIHDTSQDAIDHWLPLVRTDTLIHLELPYNARLFELLQSGDSFVSVKSLKIAGDISQTWSRILSKFPVVETLTVEAWEWRGGWSHPHIPISDLLTSLREYTGATGLMYFLLPLPTLCRITIPFWDIDNPDILEYFQLFIPPNNITSLHAKFFDFEPQHLEGLCAVFPNLTELHVEIFIEMWGNGTPLDVDCRFEVRFFNILRPDPYLRTYR